MKKLIIRLDDACEKMDVEKWDRIERLLDRYGVKPLVGIIPNCEDPMMNKYQTDDNFWYKVSKWLQKGWEIALHGYNHVYLTDCGGLNPVNKRSEFAGLDIESQRTKIRLGISILKEKGIYPKVFFAPSHTFDENTLRALEIESDIRIISDTVAWSSYRRGSFTFVPQQSGMVRRLPFKTITFCYHPNTMTDEDYNNLETFVSNHKFSSFPINSSNRNYSLIDRFFNFLYLLKSK